MMNRENAARGALALRAHRARSFTRGEGRDAELSELLADLRHYADAKGIDWETRDRHARLIHAQETMDAARAKAADHA